MRLATYNVNSIRARLQSLLAWLARAEPDVVCLQETKVVDDAFPFAELEAAGYHAAVSGQKTYNGVAILARSEISEVLRGMDDGVDDPEARLIAGTVRGIRVISAYVPNGSEPSSDKYAYKRRWLRRLWRHLVERYDPAAPLVLAGDFNIAPGLADVASPNKWQGTVLFNEEMISRLTELLDWGLEDLLAKVHPGGGIYSWWDFRTRGFEKDDGLRSDHVLATAPVARRCNDAWVDREERAKEKPSDHAPVLVELEPR